MDDLARATAAVNRALRERDENTSAHSGRTCCLALETGQACGLSPDDLATLKLAAELHDVGKIGIPDRVLLKPGPLDDEEWEVMQTHAALGAGMLADSRTDLLQLAEIVARTHHERWDGSGYPAGLAGEDIPLAGRICTIADVFDALTSWRPYKEAWPVSEALAEIRRQSGRQFDPALVEAFLELFPEEAAAVLAEDAAVPVAAG